jgi:hypothetical protein
MKPCAIPLLLLLAGLCPVACRHPEDGDEPSTEVERIDPAVDSGGAVDGGYGDLADGGQMYAATVLSVTVHRTERVPDFPPSERGAFRFRVEWAAVGRAGGELTLPYSWWDNGPPHPIAGNWDKCVWDKPPRAGQHLLLLLVGRRGADDSIRKEEGPVVHVWRGVRANHPLVRGFRDAAKFLATGDAKTQDHLFRRLCQSPFPSHREFAFRAAFFPIDPRQPDSIYGGNYDPARQSQLVLQYLEHALGEAAPADARNSVTFGFKEWLSHDQDWPQAHSGSAVGGRLAAAFESWYVTELKAVDHPDRCREALEGLDVLVGTRGLANTLALFKKGGRAALTKQLRACANAKDPATREMAQKVLAALGKE